MSDRIVLTPDDAVAIARAIEEGAEGYINPGPQLVAVLHVAERLLTTTGHVVIETDVDEPTLR